MAECAQGASGDPACGFLLRKLGVLPSEHDFALGAADFGAMAWVEGADDEEMSEDEQMSAPETVEGIVPPAFRFELTAENNKVSWRPYLLLMGLAAQTRAPALGLLC